MSKVRLFVALDFPKGVKAELARALEILRPSIQDAKWVPPDNLHLTFSFLGWVEPERVSEVSSAVATAVEGCVDFETRLGSLGAFPNPRRARVVWAGLDDPTGGLGGLAGAIDDALAKIGFAREERPFTAHVTLARLRVPTPVDTTGVELQPLAVPVERVTLFRSILGSPAPRYEPVATFPFRRV